MTTPLLVAFSVAYSEVQRKFCFKATQQELDDLVGHTLRLPSSLFDQLWYTTHTFKASDFTSCPWSETKEATARELADWGFDPVLELDGARHDAVWDEGTLEELLIGLEEAVACCDGAEQCAGCSAFAAAFHAAAQLPPVYCAASLTAAPNATAPKATA
jgi:hypothetical protein